MLASLKLDGYSGICEQYYAVLILVLDAHFLTGFHLGHPGTVSHVLFNDSIASLCHHHESGSISSGM